MTIKTILFDLDGTLTDPKQGIVKCIEYALVELGISVPDNAGFEKYIGPPLQKAFSEILKTDDHRLIEAAIDYFRERFKEKGQYENEVYDGIQVLLEKLVRYGYRLFIATSKPEVFAKSILDHFNLSGYFEAIHGSQLDGTRSDKGDLIAWILSNENLTPDTTIMIGDRKHDIDGAAANHLQSIGVLWGYGSKDELETANANYLCENIPEIAAIIQAI